MTNFLRHLCISLFCATALSGLAQSGFEVRRYSLDDGLPSNIVSCIQQDSRGLIWVGTWSGLCCFNGYEFLTCHNAGSPEERPLCNRIYLIRFDKNGDVWCMTYDGRVYIFHTATCQWTDVSRIMERKFRKSFRVRKIYTLDSGVVWLGCYDADGLAIRIGDVDRLEDATNEFMRMEEPRNRQERALWTTKKPRALDKGVPELASLKNYFVDQQDNVWSFDYQLTRFTPRRQLFTIADATPGRNTRTIPELPDIDGHQVYVALTDSKGRRWAGTKGGGLYLDGRRQEIKGNDVFDIFEDSQGHIWVACYDGGFNLLADGSFVSADDRLRNYPKERHAKVRHITETRGGVIFLSTADGIVCFSSKFGRPEDIRFRSYTTSRGKGSIPGGNVMQVLEASDGRIYISTMTGGLITASPAGGEASLTFEPVRQTQDTKGIVLSMTEDSDGCLWMARESYLERLNLKTGETMVFGRRDFGREVSFSESLPRTDAATGMITFGTYGGTLSFSPRQLTKSGFQPRVIFTSVQYQGSPERRPVLYAGEIDIPADRRNLTFFFSALDYQDNELIQYAYKIVKGSESSEGSVSSGSSSSWNYVGRAHCASFNNLPSGHLRLLVKSTNADGVWTDNVAELRIYSHPTFWETPWAWLLYLIVIAGIVSVAVYIVQMRNRHRREREELERRLEQLLQGLDTKDETAAYSLKEAEIESEEKRMMERLMAFLDQNIGDSGLKVTDLADAVNMSRSVFFDRLKKVTGMSPIDFVRYLRIQRARQMLVTTDIPVAQVCYDTGFSDPTYFTKVFKKATGMTPVAYRKSQKEA